MHIDARELADQSIIEGDLCIVGAGAAGIAMALDWMDLPQKVILLEGGGFEYDHEIQQLYSGKTTGQKYYPLMSSRLHYFGGTTGHWAGMCSPLDPLDFKKRDWVPDSGWPITKEDLDLYYAKAHKALQLGPYNYEYNYWNEELSKLTPYPLDEKVFWNKMWQFSTATYGSLYRKTIVDANNIHLYTYANVVDILLHENMTDVKEVITKNHSGKTQRVRAKRFVLACGAIQNARMLLASNSQMSQGIGNENDLVGRYFMEHLEIDSAELWLSKPFPTDLYSWVYGETKASAELSLREDVQRREKILNGTVSFSPLKIAKYLKPRMETWSDEDPRKAADHTFSHWDEAAQKGSNETGAIERAYQLQTRIEQAPNPNSRVTIGPEKDALGVPRANLHWELTPLDKRSVRTIYHLLAKEVGKVGFGRIKLKEFLQDEKDDSFPDTANGGWHHMGTTRMSEDPQKGVVDANCKVYGVSNLYIAGSACYPTSGAPNPTLTLTALTLRLSDHLKGEV